MQCFALMKPIKENLIDQSTVYSTVHKKEYYSKDNAFQKLNELVFFILHLVLQRPGIHLREIQAELQS